MPSKVKSSNFISERFKKTSDVNTLNRFSDCMMKAHFDSLDYSKAILYSPVLTITAPSCVSFRAKKRYTFVELIVGKHVTGEQSESEFTLIGSDLFDDENAKFFVSLPVGVYGIAFMAFGFNSVLYIDDVRIIDSTCQSSGKCK